MDNVEKEIMAKIIDKTDSVLIIFCILLILFLVIAFIPIYKLMIKGREVVTNNENDRMDMAVKREALIIEVVTKNTEVISGLKVLFETTLNPLLNDLENKSVDIIEKLDEIKSKIDDMARLLPEKESSKR